MNSKDMARNIANSPAFQWAMEALGADEFNKAMEADASGLIMAGYSAMQVDRVLPTEMTSDDIFTEGKLNRCPGCRQRLYRRDAQKTAHTEFHEYFISLIESKLPERIRELWRATAVHSLQCRT